MTEKADGIEVTSRDPGIWERETITFAVEPNDGHDTEVNCIACGLNASEKDWGYFIKVHVPQTGRRTWALIHEGCLKKHRGEIKL